MGVGVYQENPATKAQRCRTQFIHYLNAFLLTMEKKLIDLTRQINDIHWDDAFYEIDLNKIKQPTNISIKQRPTSFITTGKR